MARKPGAGYGTRIAGRPPGYGAGQDARRDLEGRDAGQGWHWGRWWLEQRLAAFGGGGCGRHRRRQLTLSGGRGAS